ncbi:MAG: ribonuclease H-like domain-containing protein [Acidobacteria bacterium]|nr:ribonuclease H-like domain-containing protein [Acidobacteriota bacterium]MBI3282119.1 ribonuclease H-like domain-containing protein [Acidobacteriota bacterium]
MSDLKEQLALLRRRIDRINRKYEDPWAAPASPVRPASERNPARYCIEEWWSGEQVETAHGCHFESERLYERHRRHGSMDFASLHDLGDDLLHAISEGSVAASHCTRWAFLDTETTGLAGGSGTYAFLIGVGRITPEGFRVRQFFMRDLGEEASLLDRLAAHLEEFDTLITYNGRTYDQPLLETRYRMARRRPPFGRLQHLDLLFGARRLWKLRFESCRLVDLENQILGVEREGDLPGEMIPYVYFEYLRTREAFRVAPILHHNMLDIVTLACLTAIVPQAFQSPAEAPLAHGAEMVGLARWLRAEKPEAALELLRRAVHTGLRDDLLFRTLWDIALLEKKLGRAAAAIAGFCELAACRNPFRLQALEELAKHYEHRERNYSMALEMTRTALDLADSDQLRARQARLEKRVARSAAMGRLL